LSNYISPPFDCPVKVTPSCCNNPYGFRFLDRFDEDNYESGESGESGSEIHTGYYNKEEWGNCPLSREMTFTRLVTGQDCRVATRILTRRKNRQMAKRLVPRKDRRVASVTVQL
jgi:hypothetical protein